MPTARPRPCTRRASANSATRFRLADLGVYGFDRHETTILAALVTEDPLLLVGRSGTGKTFLLNTLSEALGLEHRHYNASLISFDDVVGFPYPDEAHSTVRFLETPATVWGAGSEPLDPAFDGWRARFLEQSSACPPQVTSYVTTVVNALNGAGVRISPRRARLLARSLMAACIVADRSGSTVFRSVLVSAAGLAPERTRPAREMLP
jgi:hypothetical protein